MGDSNRSTIFGKIEITNGRSEKVTNNNNANAQCKHIYYEHESHDPSMVLRNNKLNQSKYLGHTYNYSASQMH